ncbi:MAG: hypothetical protein ABSG62_19660 [Terracidiphilus sp.]|jgi:hypothetical protein
MLNANSPCAKWSMVSVTLGLLAAVSIPMLGQAPAVHVGNTQITGLPDDWSHHHVVFSNPGTEQEAIQSGRHDEWLKVVNDPRYVLQQLKRNAPVQGPAAVDAAYRAKWIAEATGVGNSALGTAEAVEPTIGLAGRTPRPISIKKKGFSPSLKNDWSVSMGTGTSGTGGVYPAKYGFLSTQLSAYSCSDYVVFPTSGTGSSSVPNIIAFKNLYAGCGTVPNQYWAVAVNTSGTYGTVTTSPALSEDGEEVAFMETIGSSAYLVVVLMPTGNVSTVTSVTTTSCTGNTTVNSDTQGSAPEVWCGAISGPATDSHSSPFVDYTNNVLYVGDDSGVLHQFKNVFHSSTNNTKPSEAWATSVGSTNQLSSPVYDSGSGRIFVGSTNYLTADTGGKLYAFLTTGTLSVTSVSLTHSTSPGVYDGPLVDSSAELVYVVVGDDSADDGYSGVYDFAANFTSGGPDGHGPGGYSHQTFGTTTAANIVYNGAFDATYYANPGTAGNFWVCATQSSGSPQLEGVPVGGGGSLSTPVGTPLTSGAATCSPVTEYYNSSDYLFMSVTALGNVSTCGGSCVYSFTVAGSGTTATKVAGLSATGGTSGIIIDNSASSPGSNIYYEDLGDTDAVQVSQSTL